MVFTPTTVRVWLSSKIVRFGVAGAVNTLVDFGVFFLLTHYAGLWTLLANAIAFSCAVVNSYVLNKYWTFGNRTRPKAQEFRNYCVVLLIGLVLSSISIAILEEPLGVYPAKGVSIFVALVWNFFGSRKIFETGAQKINQDS